MSEEILPTIYTIGCSTHSFDSFFSLLAQHDIKVVVDVRSTPYSRHTPHFNREALCKQLVGQNLVYIYMGAEFGARREERDAYDHDQVDFERVFKLHLFEQGIERLKVGLSKGYKIALMCTEKDPMDCHRSIMVTRFLSERLGMPVVHIHFDGHLETNTLFEQRMREVTDTKEDLFSQNESELVREAYRKVEKRIAYKGEPVCHP